LQNLGLGVLEHKSDLDNHSEDDEDEASDSEGIDADSTSEKDVMGQLLGRQQGVKPGILEIEDG